MQKRDSNKSILWSQSTLVSSYELQPLKKSADCRKVQISSRGSEKRQAMDNLHQPVHFWLINEIPFKLSLGPNHLEALQLLPNLQVCLHQTKYRIFKLVLMLVYFDKENYADFFHYETCA